jgi:transposase-like protein
MSSSHEGSTEAFKGRHFNHQIITLDGRWYVPYKLRYRDPVEMMAERHVDWAHTPIRRWVRRDIPEFAKRWQCYAQPVDSSWRCDETYIQIKEQWTYPYRAVDREGQTADFFLSDHRDIAAAKRFFEQAIEKRGIPQRITLDGYAASHGAVDELQEEDTLPAKLIERTNRYLNNLIEQDHRPVKQRGEPMLGFKRFAHAVVTISRSS